MKKALILGGGGFLGHYLVDALERESFESYVLDFSPPSSSKKIRWINGNRDSREDLQKLGKYDFDCVIDLIAYRAYQTGRVIEALIGRVGCFVHVGTLSAYRPPAISPYTEQQELINSGDNSYMNQKADCERALVKAGKEKNFPYVIIRSAPVFGPHDGVSRENYYIKRIMSGSPILVPDTDKSVATMIFGSDLIDALVSAAIKSGARGKAFHIAQRELVGIRTHTREIARLLDRPVEIMSVPAEDLVRAGFNLSAFPYYSDGITYPDISAAEDVLDFKPTPYARALEETVQWFVNNDPFTQPSWPGKTSMQARMAAVNDVVQQLKEKTFIAQYKKIRREVRKQVTEFRTQYKNDGSENIARSVTAVFTGEHGKNTGGKTRRVLVPENRVGELMKSPLAQDLDAFQTVMCVVPAGGLEADGHPGPGKCESGVNTPANFNYYTLAYLEPYEKKGENLSRYYLYDSAVREGRQPAGVDYTHDYVFHVLNLFRGGISNGSGLYENDESNAAPTNKTQTYPNEIDMVYAGGDDTFPALVEELLELQTRKTITVDMAAELNKYYMGGCRLTECSRRRGGAEGQSPDTIVIDDDGNVKPCYCGKKIGTLENSPAQLGENLEKRIEEAEKKRGCSTCVVADTCPRCLFIPDPAKYCQIMKENPYLFRYIAIYDFLRQYVRYDTALPATGQGPAGQIGEQESRINLEISGSRHRHMNTALLQSLITGPRKYRVKKNLLPVVVGKKYFIYEITEGIIVRVEPVSFLIVEALEEGINDPLELAGITLYSGGRTVDVTEDDVRRNLKRLKEQALIIESGEE